MHLVESIEIAASPAIAWDITADLPRWPEWTPTITSIEVLDGAERVAEGVRARVTQPGQRPAVWTVSRVAVEGESYSFTWAARNTGMTFVARHDITPLGNGCRVTLTLDATGLTATLLQPILRPLIGKALKQEAQGLKRHAEALAGRDGTRHSSTRDTNEGVTA